MSTTTVADVMPQPNTIHGRIAARIDRLPLTAVQWRLAILVEVTWGFIIFDTDGIGARLYPFVWRPNNIIDVYQYAVIQALQVGLGILLGAYLISWVADRYGRRVAILLATASGGILPLALRLCDELLGFGLSFGPQHIGGRRHHCYARGLFVRDDLDEDPQQSIAGLARCHGLGRGIGQPARLLAHS